MPDKALGATASDQACAEIDRMTGKGASLDNYNTTSPSSGGQNGNGNYSDPSLPIIFGDNVTYTQDSVVAGTSQIALLPKSFVVSPAGNDTDFWAEVPECGVAQASLTPRCPTAGRPTSAAPSLAPTGLRRRDARQRRGQHQLWRTSGRFGADSPLTLVGEHGYYQPIRQWVVVENDDQGQSAATDLTSADGKSALAFIQYLLVRQGPGRLEPPSGMTRSAS